MGILSFSEAFCKCIAYNLNIGSRQRLNYILPRFTYHSIDCNKTFDESSENYMPHL